MYSWECCLACDHELTRYPEGRQFSVAYSDRWLCVTWVSLTKLSGAISRYGVRIGIQEVPTIRKFGRMHHGSFPMVSGVVHRPLCHVTFCSSHAHCGVSRGAWTVAKLFLILCVVTTG